MQQTDEHRSRWIPAPQITHLKRRIIHWNTFFNWPVYSTGVKPSSMRNIDDLSKVVSLLLRYQTESHLKTWDCTGRRARQLFYWQWIGSFWNLLQLCVFTPKRNVITIKCVNYVTYLGVCRSARTLCRPLFCLSRYLISAVRNEGPKKFISTFCLYTK